MEWNAAQQQKQMTWSSVFFFCTGWHLHIAESFVTRSKRSDSKNAASGSHEADHSPRDKAACLVPKSFALVSCCSSTWHCTASQAGKLSCCQHYQFLSCIEIVRCGGCIQKAWIGSESWWHCSEIPKTKQLHPVVNTSFSCEDNKRCMFWACLISNLP